MSILVVRHGQTAWSLSGQHTGTTDVPLTAEGEAQARALAPVLAARRACLVLSSPRVRARRTAELAGLAADAPVRLDDDLVEWDYGGYEGRTTAEISEQLGRPWSVWHDGVVPGGTPGETVHQVATRARAVLGRAATAVREAGGDGGADVVLVAHGHLLRVLAACWLGLSPTAGALFALDAGTWGELGHEHGRPVLTRWNVPAGG
ncbi:histidine phosphatase family protein [Paenibacillus sp. TRM 82003]|uniref:histidine phosphatase family protein n=1 Tax=Kineococcus sp. TRM81007 TaxID=2925831 RepID=UPI001F59C3BC|nr:histidine phosphatase family protein [Kineococcus sp. TRM81007]MCI2238458.1 histidine phosphatase family protein [Kineococcus sp. TRM81007]MCI3922028.1 histidine phosphatase family protein [Paenibacillus sp. TRM 82003]